MKLFTCTDHNYHWPVGVASIVVAETEPEARRLLELELQAHSLEPKTDPPFTLHEVDLSKPSAIVLCDGNY